jgi:hypothetical protein
MQDIKTLSKKDLMERLWIAVNNHCCIQLGEYLLDEEATEPLAVERFTEEELLIHTIEYLEGTI